MISIKYPNKTELITRTLLTIPTDKNEIFNNMVEITKPEFRMIL